MRRYRLREFNNHKIRIIQDQGGSRPSRAVEPIGAIPWENDYYHFKEQLTSVTRRAQDIRYFLQQYEQSPSVFNLRQLEGQLKISVREIDEIDRWASGFPFTRLTAAQQTLESNIVRHFKQEIFKAVRTIFLFKEEINLIGKRQQQNRPNQSLNYSFQSVQSINSEQNEVNQRNASIRQVSARIQSLNAVLRRMGDVVDSQGDLVNRIDQNLAEGHSNITKGREQLGLRAARETCTVEEGEKTFSCENRVNGVITGLYLIDLLLVVILVLRNL